jgi:dTDP-glucose 4,6-dehydratase
MKRIVVTGGAGFIGSNLVRRLIRAGYFVLNIDGLTYAGNLCSLEDIALLANYRFAHIDITDPQKLKSAIDEFAPDAIMHLAAESHVDRSIDGPGQFIQTNVVGSFHLLQVTCQYWQNLPTQMQEKFRFLHVSTDEVYGSLGITGKFTETSRYDPHSPYSASKAASDHLARAWFETYGLPVIVTNCSNNYGPYQFPEKLVPVVILKCLRGEPIPVYGKGENVRDWLYVEDHCEALELVLRKGQPGQSYNVGGNNELRNIDLVQTLCNLMDALAPQASGLQTPASSLISFVTDRPGHDLRYAIDSSKIQRELGWRPRQDSDSGFRTTVQWYLENQAWWQDVLSGKYRLERQGVIRGSV